MVQAFVITLREGVEIALVLAIILSYLRKTGQDALSRIVFAGTAAALLASLIGGWGLSLWAFNHDVLEGALMLVAALFVGSMTYWMWRQAKTMRQEIESRIQTLAESGGGPKSFGIFLFVFLMVLREGLETVVFLRASSLSSDTALTIIGGLAGLVLATAFAVAFIKGTLRVNLRRFFSVTTAILIVIIIQLFVSGLHELSEAQVLPSSKAEMALIGPIVRSDAFFFVVILALAILMLAMRPSPAKEPPADSQSKAALRKSVYQARRETRWKRLAAATGFIMIACITASFVYSSAPKAAPKPQMITVTGPEVQIPTAAVADGALHYFAVLVDGVAVRFFVMKADPGGAWGTALDACEICGSSGYYQDGKNVICRNCSSPIAVNSIGQTGGCNPIGLPSKVENGLIKIPAHALTRELTRRIFRAKSSG